MFPFLYKRPMFPFFIQKAHVSNWAAVRTAAGRAHYDPAGSFRVHWAFWAHLLLCPSFFLSFFIIIVSVHTSFFRLEHWHQVAEKMDY